MQILRKIRQAEGTLLWIPAEEICPNPEQPRRSFDRAELEGLAESIRRYGILQPLTVRKRRDTYELISGARRLQGAKMAGLRLVPCVLTQANAQDACILSLVENLQRRELNFAEQAEGVSRLVRVYGLSPKETAARLGKPVSAVTKMLALLRLPPDVLEKIAVSGFTERHAEALLRLDTAQSQRQALGKMAELGMNESTAEAYIDALLCGAAGKKEADTSAGRGQRSFVMKDLRLFYNSLEKNLETLRQGGLHTEIDRCEDENGLTLRIRITRK